MIDTYGLPQLFVYRNEQGPPRLLIAKVVDDFLFADSHTEISDFRKAISNYFDVGLLSQDTSLVFKRLHIQQHANVDIELSVEEYMETISPHSL